MLRFIALFLAAVFTSVAAIPTPESHFGHPIGVDRVLLDWDQVVSYFYKLGKSSPSIKVEEIGKTAEGRPFIAATISSPENLKNLDKYLEIQRRLADPRRTSQAEAEQLIPQAKNIVLITCSIHATEVASTHTAVEFAYKLLTDQSPKFQSIRQNTIVVLMPSINPDGVDIVTRWYRKTLDTPYEGTSPPELYHHYVGHDNNRDWYTFSQPETRNTIQVYNKYLPEILYDVHQQGANASRIFVPPWLDPIEPNIDPIIAQEMNLLGLSVATDLTADGKKGVAVHAAYDFWSPARHYQAFHDGLRILTESASAKLATPITLTKEQLDTHPLGYNAQERSWNHLEPWPGGTWHLRDIVDYQMVAFESVLYNASLRREDMVRNYYKVGQRAVARTTPYAFVIPAQQRDPGATRHLLEILNFGMVEINKAANGDHVILMQQPYSSWAKALLERQDYPDLRMYPGGPPQRPYDTTAETLPLLFGVDSKAVTTPITGSLTKETFPFDAASLTAFNASDTDSWETANKLWNANKPVWRNTKTGDFSDADKGDGWKKLAKPRVALYRSYNAAMDEGWTRWLLEKFGFAYKNVSNTDIQKGSLKQSFDVIVFPDQAAQTITRGFREGSMPKEYTGGVGDNGIAALKQFASDGGTLVCLNHSTDFCTESLGAAATNVVESRVAAAGGDESHGGAAPQGGGRRAGGAGGFYSPGSLLNVKLNLDSPLTLGLPQNIAIWSEQSPAFTSDQTVVAAYPESDILASGWLLGANLIAGKAAIVDAKLGSGHVILFGLRPQYRAQSYQAFKLFFNSFVAYR
ncbi:MAG TPA: M14 metallopeptidase family protein [Bryobacteraceae bacterium]|nr:M14 metallopeptidase family protein [Bryobacteraceae bacterium]